MDIQMISEQSFSVYITSEELERRHLSADTLSLLDAEDIISGVFGAPVGRAKLELFPGKDDLLIFVRRSSEYPELYTFGSIEPVIEAAHTVSADPSALFWYDGVYILAVWRLEIASGSMREFGDRLEAPPEFLPHLREHGRVLIAENAIAAIKRVFWGDKSR